MSKFVGNNLIAREMLTSYIVIRKEENLKIS